MACGGMGETYWPYVSPIPPTFLIISHDSRRCITPWIKHSWLAQKVSTYTIFIPISNSSCTHAVAVCAESVRSRRHRDDIYPVSLPVFGYECCTIMMYSLRLCVRTHHMPWISWRANIIQPYDATAMHLRRGAIQ